MLAVTWLHVVDNSRTSNFVRHYFFYGLMRKVIEWLSILSAAKTFKSPLD